MIEYITSGLSQVLTWVGTVISALFTEGGALATLGPMFAIGISISVLMLGFLIIKKAVWGS